MRAAPILALVVLLFSGCSDRPGAGSPDCPPGAAPTQGAVLFGIVEAEWGDPLEDAIVWTEIDPANHYQALTGPNGCYRLEIPYAGQWAVQAEKDGFDGQPKVYMLAEGDVTRADFILFTHVES